MFIRKKLISSAIACGALALFTFASSRASADETRLTVKPAVQQTVDGNDQGATIQLARWGHRGWGGGYRGGWGGYRGYGYRGFGGYRPYYGGFGYGLGAGIGYGAYGYPGYSGFGYGYPAYGYGYGYGYPRMGYGVGIW